MNGYSGEVTEPNLRGDVDIIRREVGGRSGFGVCHAWAHSESH